MIGTVTIDDFDRDTFNLSDFFSPVCVAICWDFSMISLHPQPQAQPASTSPAQANAPQPGQAAPRPAAPPVARPATAAVAGAAEARRPGGAGGRAAQRPANVKIGRNEMVTVMNPTTGEKQEMKFKKAEPLIRNEGWRLVPSA